MAKIGGIIGALVALAVVILPIEWIDADALSDTAETIVGVVVAAVGAFAGSQLARRVGR